MEEVSERLCTMSDQGGRSERVSQLDRIEHIEQLIVPQLARCHGLVYARHKCLRRLGKREVPVNQIFEVNQL
jgi:hypothetical protein